MKCSKCGKEVALGDIYCSQCGSEIQIVPDYNVFGDDFSDVIQQKEQNRNIDTKSAEEEKKELEKQREIEQKVKEAKKKNLIILCVSLGVIALIALILIISIVITSNSNKKSFNYNFSMAEECFENDMLDDALIYADLALKADSDNVYAGLLKAEILGEQKKFEDAIEVLYDVIEYHPSNIRAYNLIIHYCMEISDHDAIKELAKDVEDDKVAELLSDYIADTPTFSHKPGNYGDEITLTLSTESNSIIYYTIDGTSPFNNGVLYTDEILLTEGVTTIRAYATNEHGIVSDEVEGTYVVSLSLPDKPEATVPSGTYKEAQIITIYVPVGWTAYYTWDGTVPTEESNIYTEPFEMIAGNNVLSIIFINDEEPHKMSDVAYYNYIYYPDDESQGNQDEEVGDNQDDEGEDDNE